MLQKYDAHPQVSLVLTLSFFNTFLHLTGVSKVIRVASLKVLLVGVGVRSEGGRPFAGGPTIKLILHLQLRPVLWRRNSRGNFERLWGFLWNYIPPGGSNGWLAASQGTCCWTKWPVQWEVVEFYSKLRETKTRRFNLDSHLFSDLTTFIFNERVFRMTEGLDWWQFLRNNLIIDLSITSMVLLDTFLQLLFYIPRTYYTIIMCLVARKRSKILHG